MVIEEEYRGMAYTTQEQEEDLGYTIILRYYREKHRLIDGSEVYAVRIESKKIYKQDDILPGQYEESEIISTDKNIANQIIEIFRINQVFPSVIKEVYESIEYIKENMKQKYLNHKNENKS